MKKLSSNQVIAVWFSVQFILLASCGVHHIGELIVGGLLFVSLAGFIFGTRKVRITSLFGLAAYSALSFICAVTLVMLYSFRPYTTTIYGIIFVVYLIITLINLFIVFKTLKNSVRR